MGKTYKSQDKYNNNHKKNRRESCPVSELDEESLRRARIESDRNRYKNYSTFEDAPEFCLTEN